MIGKDGQSSKRKRHADRDRRYGMEALGVEVSIVVDSRKARARQAIVIQEARAIPKKTENKRRRRRH